jgi:hypothetical protein
MGSMVERPHARALCTGHGTVAMMVTAMGCLARCKEGTKRDIHQRTLRLERPNCPGRALWATATGDSACEGVGKDVCGKRGSSRRRLFQGAREGGDVRREAKGAEADGFTEAQQQMRSGVLVSRGTEQVGSGWLAGWLAGSSTGHGSRLCARRGSVAWCMLASRIRVSIRCPSLDLALDTPTHPHIHIHTCTHPCIHSPTHHPPTHPITHAGANR